MKSATCTFFVSIKNVACFLFIRFDVTVDLANLECFLGKLKFTFNVAALEVKKKIPSHPLLRSASAFEACCHDALRHVLYSAAKIVCSLQMSHSKVKCGRLAIGKNGRHYITQHKWHILNESGYSWYSHLQINYCIDL